MALVVVLVLLAVMMLVTITLSGRMQQQLGRTRSQQEYQQALWYSASAESLALSALSLSLKNEKRVHLEQPWASGPRFLPLYPPHRAGSTCTHIPAFCLRQAGHCTGFPARKGCIASPSRWILA